MDSGMESGEDAELLRPPGSGEDEPCNRTATFRRTRSWLFGGTFGALAVLAAIALLRPSTEGHRVITRTQAFMEQDTRSPPAQKYDPRHPPDTIAVGGEGCGYEDGVKEVFQIDTTSGQNGDRASYRSTSRNEAVLRYISKSESDCSDKGAPPTRRGRWSIFNSTHGNVGCGDWAYYETDDAARGPPQSTGWKEWCGSGDSAAYRETSLTILGYPDVPKLLSKPYGSQIDPSHPPEVVAITGQVCEDWAGNIGLFQKKADKVQGRAAYWSLERDIFSPVCLEYRTDDFWITDNQKSGPRWTIKICNKDGALAILPTSDQTEGPPPTASWHTWCAKGDLHMTIISIKDAVDSQQRFLALPPRWVLVHIMGEDHEKKTIRTGLVNSEGKEVTNSTRVLGRGEQEWKGTGDAKVGGGLGDWFNLGASVTGTYASKNGTEQANQLAEVTKKALERTEEHSTEVDFYMKPDQACIWQYVMPFLHNGKDVYAVATQTLARTTDKLTPPRCAPGCAADLGGSGSQYQRCRPSCS